MNKKRILVAGVGLAMAAALFTGCATSSGVAPIVKKDFIQKELRTKGEYLFETDGKDTTFAPGTLGASDDIGEMRNSVEVDTRFLNKDSFQITKSFKYKLNDSSISSGRSSFIINSTDCKDNTELKILDSKLTHSRYLSEVVLGYDDQGNLTGGTDTSFSTLREGYTHLMGICKQSKGVYKLTVENKLFYISEK